MHQEDKDEFAEFEDEDGELRNETPREGAQQTEGGIESQPKESGNPGYATKSVVKAPKKPKPFEEMEMHKQIYKFFRVSLTLLCQFLTFYP